MIDALAGMRGFDLQDVLEILQRRWRWLLWGAVCGLLVGLLLWWLLPRRYEATMSILVEPQGVPESYVRSTITLDLSQRMGTLQQRMTSYPNLSELIEVVGRERLDPKGEASTEDLMNEIRSNVGIWVERQRGDRERGPTASVVWLRYEGSNPAVLSDVVSEMGNLFVSESHKARARQAESTEAFLNNELRRVELDLASQEEKIRDYRMSHLGALPEQLEGNYKELDRLNESLRSNLEAQEKLSSEMAMLRRRVGEGGPGPSDGSLAAALIEARRELIRAKRVYTDDHPNVRSLEAQIEQLQRDLEETGDDADAVDEWVDPIQAREIDAVHVNLEVRRREEAHLRERLAVVQKRVEDTPKHEQELSDLTRGYDIQRKTYQLLLGNQHDASLSRNLEAAKMAEQFKVLRPPRVPDEPFSPDPLLLVPVSLAAGLGLAALLIVWAEFRTPAFHSVDTLARRLGLPILAAIPELDREKIYQGLSPPEGLDWKLVVAGAPRSAAAEQYRGFAPHFLEQESCRVILATSAQPGDGKSITCANLAWILATDVGRRVLIIDSDLRRAYQHRLFGVPREPGVSEVLRGESDLRLCTRSISDNLSLLCAGGAVENPVALLTSESFVKLCERAAESYEVVMIDSPPIMPVIDAKILRRLADMVIFVVRAGVSPSGGVVRSLKELNTPAGLVFNRVSTGAFRRYYYYDAYSHYEYADRDAAPPQESGGRASTVARLLDRWGGSA